MVDRLAIAIDGPAGAGKSTVARILAERLGFVYLDTGAMYRAVTLKAIREGVDLHDGDALTALAERTDVRVVPDPHEGSSCRVLLDGEDATWDIRSPQVNDAVSVVAAVPGVRRRLVKLQREAARGGRIVLDGRDAGTCVLPEADLKVYLTASFSERVRRRLRELEEAGYSLTAEEVRSEIEKRDRLDSCRSVGPLRPAPDAVIVDTTKITALEAVERILRRLTGEVGA